jgi:proline iminopeptidase
MQALFPDIAPHSSGMLPVGNGCSLYWEVCGNSNGKPAVVIHGGPGSGCTPWHRRLFDPAKYNIVLFDQRGCGRSRPHASAFDTDLSTNTTDHLTADIELLRQHLKIPRWLMLGGSWGSALALTYGERYPAAVSELVLYGVTTGRRQEFDWLFREGLGAFFPEAWEARRQAIPDLRPDEDIVEAFCRRLQHPDEDIRLDAARAWCMWESATPDWPPRSELAPRFRDPKYALAFARLVTHYVRHDGWLGDGRVLDNVLRLGGIPGVMVCGRFDFQSPIGTAWELNRRWPHSRLVVVNDAGHSPTDVVIREIIQATNEFARID